MHLTVILRISQIFQFGFFQCDTVLEIDPKNVKAYYRRGTSHLESGDPQSALEDFTKV